MLCKQMQVHGDYEVTVWVFVSAATLDTKWHVCSDINNNCTKRQKNNENTKEKKKKKGEIIRIMELSESGAPSALGDFLTF